MGKLSLCAHPALPLETSRSNAAITAAGIARSVLSSEMQGSLGYPWRRGSCLLYRLSAVAAVRSGSSNTRHAMTEQIDTATSPKFRIFRGSDGRPCDLMTYGDGPPASGSSELGIKAPASDAPALDEGHDLRVLFDTPGMSLVRAWFKSEFPLPRHTHDVDCVYYITGGSLRMAEKVLRAGDGFFVGANVPYTYTPGPEGVEILEFRSSNAFNIKVMGDMAKVGEKSLVKIASQQDAWSTELAPPSS